MIINNMFDGGAAPVLERIVQFTQARQQVLAHNVANLSTPYFKPVDLDPKAFNAALNDAIRRRRDSGNPVTAPLEMRDTHRMSFKHGRVEIRPTPVNEGILFHDQNNRDLERMMQKVAENNLTHSAAVEMLRKEWSILETAIRGRV